jgi:hypothetical protein
MARWLLGTTACGSGWRQVLARPGWIGWSGRTCFAALRPTNCWHSVRDSMWSRSCWGTRRSVPLRPTCIAPGQAPGGNGRRVARCGSQPVGRRHETSESTFWRFGLVPGFFGDRLGRCVEELVDGEQFAPGAGAAGPDPAGGPVAVVAPLFGEVAGVALVALVDGVLSARSGGGQGCEDVPSSVELRWRPDDHQATFTISS